MKKPKKTPSIGEGERVSEGMPKEAKEYILKAFITIQSLMSQEKRAIMEAQSSLDYTDKYYAMEIGGAKLQAYETALAAMLDLLKPPKLPKT